ncbi:hypothetical protein [Maribacter sp. HTCC2170]|uniref:hypothetical protein n=1 Tax=Maribacter sp. (strain HTCC2170 / KCCM 42371) TaxID=313603 RepID=UPI00006B21C3|nr:hypothetical protein [Maribacter sp. HTCC2170]EAR00306.1 hypothetical protein FB2170_12831 [Maribacter sp. HTCC2170]
MKKVLLFLLLFQGPWSLFSQDQKTSLPSSSAEKIYLQLDGGVYTTDQTVWFKAIVVNASYHESSVDSGVLHVELIDEKGQITEKKLVKLTNGLGQGFFELNQTYEAGLYLVRAYTEWNKNFGDDFVFNTYIDVFSNTIDKKEAPISDISLIEMQKGEFILKATLKPHLLDEKHRNKLNVYLAFDKQKDSLVIKKSKDNTYQLLHSVPFNASFVKLTLVTDNLIRHSQTVVLNDKYLDIQFYPESGRMVHGLTNKIAFKALDYSGKGTYVAGDVVDENDSIVKTFGSNPKGMGTFLIQANKNKAYYARIPSHSNQGLFQKYPLPKVVDKGSILSITKAGKNIRIKAFSNYKETDSVFIRVSCRGIDHYLIEGTFKDRLLIAQLPANELPEGILAFSMLDQNKMPTAERLYFNELPRNRLRIELSTDKESYGHREKTELKAQVFGQDRQAVDANLSILVINRDQLGELQNRRVNILSYFLLDSELKGPIEDPRYYFNSENRERVNDLDALLLTQGWRKYNYSEGHRDTIMYQTEPTLQLGGTVNANYSKKKQFGGVNLSMMTFGETPSFYNQVTDSLGRFKFQLQDEFGPPIKALIQSANKSGKKRSYAITLDATETPDIVIDSRKSIEKLDSVVHLIAEKHRERRTIEDSYKPDYGVTALAEVIVEGQKLTPQRKKVIDEYGEPDIVIPGTEIRDKEKKWSYGLYSVLLFNYPNEISIEQFPDGFMLAHINGGGTTLVVIDGIPVLDFQYPLIPHISPSEVKSVELIKYIKNFVKLYTTVFSDYAIESIPKLGSVIAIFTHAGKGISGVHKAKGLSQNLIPVFSPTRQFNAPNYNKPNTSTAFQPDLRSLIHWEPIAEVNSDGSFVTSFYNADTSGKMLVIVEAITENGEIGYTEMVYPVKNERP